MQLQLLEKRLLLVATYEMLFWYSIIGVATSCGPDLPRYAVETARAISPHVSAMTLENVKLIWEDVQFQADAWFVDIIQERDLFQPQDLLTRCWPSKEPLRPPDPQPVS
jgi:hypothetical protein